MKTCPECGREVNECYRQTNSYSTWVCLLCLEDYLVSTGVIE